MKSIIPEIREVKAYKIGNSLYRTKQAAAKKRAWNIILSKYLRPENDAPKKLEDIKELYGMTCECYERDYSQCELHCTYNGYFKRLHTRLVNRILAIWDTPPTETRA